MYCDDLARFKRRSTHKVKIGSVLIGGDEPIVVQTMLSKPTSDIEGCVQQIIRTVEAGSQVVRITVPSMRDIENIKKIKESIRSKGLTVPLVADIHFNQKIAFEAAKVVEKVRINPGNFADSKKDQLLEYTQNQYNLELERIKNEFLPLLDICKAHDTSIRIGTNHGSLSDRIMSRYGDTPMGMVESAMEFTRICDEAGFKDVVISMKSSNTLVMVQATRLLTNKMKEEGQTYPLHLGVTEAGEGEDGRIKSAVGIGALLADGIGDTIRVSLTEEPEYEIPVAQKLLDSFKNFDSHTPIPEIENCSYDPFNFTRRETETVLNVGSENVPVVLLSSEMKITGDLSPDYSMVSSSYQADDINEILLEIKDTEPVCKPESRRYPIISFGHPELETYIHPGFVKVLASEIDAEGIEILKRTRNKVLVIHSNNENAFSDIRAAIIRLTNEKVKIPIVINHTFIGKDIEELQLQSAAIFGGLLLDGLCDGIWIENKGNVTDLEICSTAFGILQASRMRVTKPDYISCPSCGRTQFNIQETTKTIRLRTAHLKGLKIGIMGCIVNGLGEMADADYGYIGGAPGKVNLYHKKELIKRGVSEDLAVDELVNLIKNNGDWLEPKSS